MIMNGELITAAIYSYIDKNLIVFFTSVTLYHKSNLGAVSRMVSMTMTDFKTQIRSVEIMISVGYLSWSRETILKRIMNIRRASKIYF